MDWLSNRGVSLLTFLIRRFWKYRERKNENQLTPVGIYMRAGHDLA